MNLEKLIISKYPLIVSSGRYEISSSLDEIILKMEKDSSVYLFYKIENSKKFTIDVSDNSEVIINLVNTSTGSDFSLSGHVSANASLKINVADFANKKNTFKCLVNLEGEKATCYTHLATVSKNDDNKTFEINLNHLYKDTVGKVECYGVAKNNSKIVFSGSSFIKNKAVKSSTSQIAKAMIFDKDSVATAKPILAIDENDVIASHSAAVGRINEDHIYYLTSRGLSVEEARELITLGYLKPIINKFDEEHKESVERLIEGSL